MKMTLSDLRHLTHPVDKLLLVSVCGKSYQLYAEDQGIRFAVYDEKGNPVASQSIEQGKSIIQGIKHKEAVLYQQLPYDEACAVTDTQTTEMSPAMEIAITVH